MKTNLIILLLICVVLLSGCIDGYEKQVKVKYWQWGETDREATIGFNVNGRQIDIHPSPCNSRPLAFTMDEIWVLQKFISQELMPKYREEYIDDEIKLYDPETTQKEIGKIFKRRKRR